MTTRNSRSSSVPSLLVTFFPSFRPFFPTPVCWRGTGNLLRVGLERLPESAWKFVLCIFEKKHTQMTFSLLPFISWRFRFPSCARSIESGESWDDDDILRGGLEGPAVLGWNFYFSLEKMLFLQVKPTFSSCVFCFSVASRTLSAWPAVVFNSPATAVCESREGSDGDLLRAVLEGPAKSAWNVVF